MRKCSMEISVTFSIIILWSVLRHYVIIHTSLCNILKWNIEDISVGHAELSRPSEAVSL